MQHLHGRYGAMFNARHSEHGHVFRGRYATKLVESDEHLLAVYRYIALNPVRAGMCARADDWPWCSYQVSSGAARLRPWHPQVTLPHFDEREDPQVALRRVVEAAEGSGRLEV